MHSNKAVISIILPAFTSALELMASCDDDESVAEVDGTYSGRFTRMESVWPSLSSDVVLILEHGKFQGSSSQEKYPAICTGTYFTSGNKITFVNSCPWTAEFDWTLILGGEYIITELGDGMILSRKYVNGVVDTYVLHRQ